MNFTQQQFGMTLVELLAAVAIVGILTTLGTPPILNWLARQNINALSSDLARDVHFARAAATHHGMPVTLCAARTDSQCDPASRLSDGWIVFINTDDDSPAVRDADEQILRVHAPAPDIRTRSNRTAFKFRPVGVRSTNGTVIACAPGRAAGALALVISYTGRARIVPAPAIQTCS